MIFRLKNVIRNFKNFKEHILRVREKFITNHEFKKTGHRLGIRCLN